MCFLRYKMLIVLYVVNKTTWVGFSCSRWSFDYSYLRSTQSFGWMFEFVFWIGWIIKYIEYNPKNKHVHVTNYFWPKFTTGREKKIRTSAIPHISQELHECGKLSWVQMILVQVTVEKWYQDQYFSQKVLLMGTSRLIL